MDTGLELTDLTTTQLGVSAHKRPQTTSDCQHQNTKHTEPSEVTITTLPDLLRIAFLMLNSNPFIQGALIKLY